MTKTSSVKERKIQTAGERVFLACSNAVLTVLSLCALLPFVLLVVSSLTSEQSLAENGYSFIPKEWSAESYIYLFTNSSSGIFRAYGITIFVTVCGTVISLFICALLAYAISRKDYPRRGLINFIVFFTMLFNGGMVPTYLMWTGVFNIKNTLAAYIFPSLLVSAFFTMLMKSFFATNIHPALIEAAKIDGAGEFTIFFRIVLPLSLPILATIGLMTAINYWNDWINGLYYVTKNDLYSLQHLLNKILTNIQAISTMSDSVTITATMPSTSIRMAMAVVGALPILLLYPFFQKYFVKGISLGGVKE